MKTRVHELAKKYSIKNKEFLEILRKDVGIDIKSHLANVDDDEIKKIEDYFAKINMHKVEAVEQVKPHKEKKEEKVIRKIIADEEDDDDEKKETYHIVKDKNNKHKKNISLDEEKIKSKNKKKKVEEQILY